VSRTSAKRHKQTSRPNRPWPDRLVIDGRQLRRWSHRRCGKSRPPVRGRNRSSASRFSALHHQFSALHTAGLPTRLFGVVL